MAIKFWPEKKEKAKRTSPTQKRSSVEPDLLKYLGQFYRAFHQILSPEKIKNYDDVFIRLLNSKNISENSRKEFVSKLAECDHIPAETLHMIAMDNDEKIASIVLQNASSFDEEHLELYINNLSPSHQLVIAGRKNLSEHIIRLLVKTDNEEIWPVLAANIEVSIPEDIFGILYQKARLDKDLAVMLATRTDLPASIIKSLYGEESGEIRTILHRSGHTLKAIEMPNDEPLDMYKDDENWLAEYDFDNSFDEVKSKYGDKVDEAVLLQACKHNNFTELVILLSIMSNMEIDELKYCLISMNTQKYVALAHSLDLSEVSTEQILSCGPWRYRLSTQKRHETMRLWHEVKKQAALYDDEAEGKIQSA